MCEVETTELLSLLRRQGMKNLLLADGFEETNTTNWSDYSFEVIISMGMTPPIISDSFNQTQKWNLKVMVPTEALEAYQNAPVWRDFFYLKGGAERTGMESVVREDYNAGLQAYSLDGVKVEKTVPGHIYIRGGKKFIAK